MARRPADHTGRRRLQLRDAESVSSAVRLLLQECREGGKNRPNEVKFTFDQTGNRELPDITAQLTILPKHYWEGTDASGKKRDIAATTLEPPLGSGPYRVKEIKPGKSISYERVEDHWARDLPIMKGRNNFDEVQIVYFRDSHRHGRGFQGRAAGRTERKLRQALGDGLRIPRRKAGNVIKQVFKTKNPQAWRRSSSIRAGRNSPIRGSGARSTTPSISSGPTRTSSSTSTPEPGATSPDRSLRQRTCRRASSWKSWRTCAADTRRSLQGGIQEPDGQRSEGATAELPRCAEAVQGSRLGDQDKVLVNAKSGERMQAEFLLFSPDSERIILPYKRSLERLGIKVSGPDGRQLAISEPAGKLRLRHRARAAGASRSRPATSSAISGAPRRPTAKGSRNWVGIKNPAIDKLIDRIIFSKDREEQLAATRAMDRVLLWNHYVVPQLVFQRLAHRPLEPVRPPARSIRSTVSAILTGGGTTRARLRP